MCIRTLQTYCYNQLSKLKVLDNSLLSCEGDVNIVFTKAFDRLCMRALHSKLATTTYDETHNSKLDIEHTKYNTK